MEIVTAPRGSRVRTCEIVSIWNLSHWMYRFKTDKSRITLSLSESRLGTQNRRPWNLRDLTLLITALASNSWTYSLRDGVSSWKNVLRGGGESSQVQPSPFDSTLCAQGLKVQ